MSNHIFERFDQVRIINLVERADRRREMLEELGRVGGMAPNISFYEAHRPEGTGGFPSVGARGCFQSHLEVLRAARDAGVESLLILEDDFDFNRDGRSTTHGLLTKLFSSDWDIFYGAHMCIADGRKGLVAVSPDEPVATTSFVAFRGRVLQPLIEFLEAVMARPPGSKDYGPMHVDGAYTVFRLLHPQYVTVAAFPSLGRQRSSHSDVTPGNMLLDRWAATRRVAGLLRRIYNSMRRH